MSEVDKELSGRYRAASRDEPPAHVDAAILAAAKRAVGSQPRSLRRWYLPVSLAAVITLSVIVTLNIERERPQVVMADAVPVVREKEQKLAPPAPQPQPAFAPDPKPAAKPALEAARMEKPRGDTLRSADAARGPAAVGSVANERTAEIPAASAPAAARATLAKRELAPEEWLERIAGLRKQGEDKEADEQFAEFKRRYPDYKIPETMTERIAPRK